MRISKRMMDETFFWVGILMVVTVSAIIGDAVNVTERIADLLAMLPRLV